MSSCTECHGMAGEKYDDHSSNDCPKLNQSSPPADEQAAADELDKAVQFLANHIWEKSESFSYDDDEKRAEMLYARKFMAEAIAAYSRTQTEGVLSRLWKQHEGLYSRPGSNADVIEAVPLVAIDAELQRLRGKA